MNDSRYSVKITRDQKVLAELKKLAGMDDKNMVCGEVRRSDADNASHASAVLLGRSSTRAHLKVHLFTLDYSQDRASLGAAQYGGRVEVDLAPESKRIAHRNMLTDVFVSVRTLGAGDSLEIFNSPLCLTIKSVRSEMAPDRQVAEVILAAKEQATSSRFGIAFREKIVNLMGDVEYISFDPKIEGIAPADFPKKRWL